MKFYIASRLENFTQVQALSGKLRAAGWVHTFDWTYDWTKQGSVHLSNKETLESIGKKEFEGVSDADIIIVLTPQGRGTHIELGMAIALNKTIFLCHADDTYFKCDDNTCSFYCLPQVIQVIGNTEEIAESVLGYKRII